MDSSETSSWLPGMLALQELRNWRPSAKGGTPVTNEEMVVAQGRYQRSVTAACLGSCALGTTLGYASSALPSISKEPWYSVHASRWFLDGPLLVAALGALASGFLVSQLGNRRTLLVSAVGFAGGALIVNLATNMYTLFLGRAVGGFYLGVTYNCATTYVAEIAPADKRTCLAGFVEVASGGGLLLAYSAGSYLDWEHLASLCALPPLLLVYLSSYVLESPYWLLRRGRQREAGIAANRLYGFQIPTEIKHLCIDGSLGVISGGHQGWHARKIAVCVSLQALHNLSCAQLLLLRNVQVLAPLASDFSPHMGAIGMASLHLGVSSVAAGLTRQLGRRPLLLVSAFVVAFSLSVFKPLDQGVPEAWPPEPGSEPSSKPGSEHGSEKAALVALCSLVVGHSLGLGHVPSLVMGELVPGRMRYSCSACVSAFRWLLGFLILHFDVHFVSLVRYRNSFLALSLAAFLLACAVAVYLPETEGRSLADIEKDD
ncbi:solute carrier family 2, facilitated glucose transporter member 8 [Ixodes scapularis]|uniref:solute carrier family 2, facilitated glucose transporter member 8 n=1 Tax=Ixodes scapularis TaxID=6945 RepID=UPI001C3929E7|nr:solute carrier family 2, facilitated glucose transporter member 8 [Ixodes scapularis]